MYGLQRLYKMKLHALGMPGSSIVYVSSGLLPRAQQPEPPPLRSLLHAMMCEEPCVFEGLCMYRNFVECMTFTVGSAAGGGLRLTDDENTLRRFCRESVAYYFAMRFVPFRFVPTTGDKRVLAPVCIPMQQIDFYYDVQNLHSVHHAPHVFYAQRELLALAAPEEQPQIFVYKFPTALMDPFCLGPLALLCNSYLEMLKVREHNSLVVAENMNTVQYVEHTEAPNAQGAPEGGIIAQRTTLDFVQMEREEQHARHKKDTIRNTRDLIHEQMDEMETSNTRYMQEKRERYVILPPNTRVNSSATHSRLTFMSCVDTGNVFQTHVARVFELQKSTGEGARGYGVDRDRYRGRKNQDERMRDPRVDARRLTNTMSKQNQTQIRDAEPGGVRKFRNALQELLTTVASVLADPKLDDKLREMDESNHAGKRAKAVLYKKSGYTGAASVPLQEVPTDQRVECEIEMDTEHMLHTCKSHNIHPELVEPPAPARRKDESGSKHEDKSGSKRKDASKSKPSKSSKSASPTPHGRSASKRVKI
jgi:hypothetical protein